MVLAGTWSAAEARPLGEITNGRDPITDEPLPENPSKDYHISCLADINGVSVFTSPDTTKRYRDDSGDIPTWGGSKGVDLTDVRIVYANGRQFLSGQIIQYVAGGGVFSLEKSAKETEKGDETDRFYVLPEEWDCRLYRGDREASCSSDAALISYAKLYKRYQTECQH